MIRKLCLFALMGFTTAACSGSSGTSNTPPPQQPEQAARPLLQQTGELTAGGRRNYDVPVEAGQQVVVALTSQAFDPILEVTPPGAAPLTNDDWHGSRSESRLSVIVAETGTLKVGVSAFGGATGGAFEVRVDRGGMPATARPGSGVTQVRPTPATAGGIASQLTASVPAMLGVGQTFQGQLGPGDAQLADGRYQEQLLVSGANGAPLSLFIQAQTQAIPSAVVLDPQGHTLQAASNGSYTITQPGPHRVQIIAPAGQEAGYTIRLDTTAAAPSASPPTPSLTREHHQLPTTTGGAALSIGTTVRGQMTPSAQLPTGEPMVQYTLQATSGQSLNLDLRSDDFDTYLIVIGPNGRHWENDDFGGTLNSQVSFEADVTGTYRVVATAYRQGMGGAFELASHVGGVAPTPTGARPSPTGAGAGGMASPTRTERGQLQQGDRTLHSGEFMDTYNMTFPAGQSVRLEAFSTEFDTYLIVHPPGGAPQIDNDDQVQGNTNAAVDFVSTGGEYRIVVTSYRPGETGSYELRVGGGGGGGGGGTASPTPAPTGPSGGTPVTGDSVAGSLASGDETLRSGEFADHLTRTFSAGQSVEIRLTSSQFDPYLIVHTPSGRQMDNDDINGETRDAGITIPAAETGEYRITVTSYRPGETGRYSLTFGAGAAIPRPGGSGGGDDGATGGRIFGVFVGISDYPGQGNDLPECANDAVKLAQALRERSLLVETRQVMLTDSQATVANVRQAMQRMAQQIRPDDIFVFFYSGHGGQTGGGSTDSREIDGNDEYLVLYDGQLMDNEMGTLFDGIQARVAVLALDACFSGGFAKDVITRPGRIGLFSSEEDVLSAVASQFQAGGYLSHFLRTAVQGSADSAPNDGVLTVGELTHYLYRQFGQHAADVELQGAYQHLVVDRGAVTVDQVLWSYR